MVALVVSTILAVVMCFGVIAYAKRRSADVPMTWGEAMIFSAVIFFIMFVAWGIIPHQWLTLAENEWSFREDRIFTAWGLLEPISQGGWFPFDITYRVLSDSVAALIYIVTLVPMAKLWGTWQTRGSADSAKTEIQKSTYGRPLVRKS
jgi:hypothetical protein